MPTRATLQAFAICLDPSQRVGGGTVEKLATHACKTFVVTRAYDCTPVPVALAHTSRSLRPYVVRASDEWTTKSFADDTWGSGRAVPSFGVIELTGQEVTIHCAAKGRLLNHRFSRASFECIQ